MHEPLLMNAPTSLVTGPRERLVMMGIDTLADSELLVLLLGSGNATEPVEVLATRILHEHGGLEGLVHAGAGELATRRGLGVAKGARIAAAVELGRRIGLASERIASTRLPDCRAVDAWARTRLAALDHEELWVLALDGNNGLRAARCVARGGLHGMYVASRDPLRAVLREGASAFILVHNHPSGDPTPSAEDISFTASLSAAADVVATPLLDHVVVARKGFVSMLERKLLPSAPLPSPPPPRFT
jgi:DNA repair protein RadC